jgi:predicted transcriptional regulator
MNKMIVRPKNVIISIKPEYALKIISGEKTIELRRKFPTKNIEGGIALIYASSPIQEIIGYAIIAKVKRLSIDQLWKTCGKRACVTKEFFYAYFEGLDHGFALEMSEPVKLTKPLDIRRMEEEFLVSAPQSFRYAPDKVLDCVAA